MTRYIGNKSRGRMALFVLLGCLSLTAQAADQDDDWRAMIRAAYDAADIVVRAKVLSIDNQTAVDGGHVYTLAVDAVQKGTGADEISVRAGGWMYTLVMKKNQSALLFLKDRGGAHYSLIDASGFRPMVFTSGGTPVDGRLTADFASVASDELAQLISELEAQQ